jgi:HEAT repeat protein
MLFVRWEAAAEALVEIGNPAVDRLLEMTRDEVWFMREEAARALGRIGESWAVDRLLEMTRDEDGYVRVSAGRALWQIAGSTRSR